MLDAATIRELAAEEGFPRVSIFMPTFRSGPDLRQNPIQLKNLIRDAAAELERVGLSAREGSALLAELVQRLESGDLWRAPEDGLAIFISPDETRIFWAPLPFEAQVHVNRRFVVRPLLPLAMRDGTFWVLAASRDDVALYRGSRFGLARIRDERLPASADGVFGEAEIENAVGFHASARGGAAARIHALGESAQDETDGLMDEFAVRIAKGVESTLGGDRSPLVIAADDRLLGKLRRSLQGASLAEEAIREHPASLELSVLHARAYDIVRPQLDAARAEVIGRLEGRLGEGAATASRRIEEIVAAAEEGRVESLVVAARDVDRVDLGWNVGTMPEPAEALEMLDRAVIGTLNHGGVVLSRPADRARDLPAVAALYRY
ncbi:MAG: hypothetical protein AB7P02_13825 [Alphaproteobacteria bacterium]